MTANPNKFGTATHLSPSGASAAMRDPHSYCSTPLPVAEALVRTLHDIRSGSYGLEPHVGDVAACRDRWPGLTITGVDLDPVAFVVWHARHHGPPVMEWAC